jgi:hypothetical protein
VPGAVGTKSLDVAEPPTWTTFWDMNTWLVQLASLNSRKVIVPVGTRPPTSDAVLRTGVPTGPPADAETRMVGERRLMTMVKVWQRGAVVALLAQTVVGPKVPATVGEPVRNPVGARVSPGGRVPAVTENTRSGVDAVNWWT